MRLLVVSILHLYICVHTVLWAQIQTVPVYKDHEIPVEERITDLLLEMTLEEKVWQLTQYTLGINNNENNIEKTVQEVPAEIGSLIYFEMGPELRNRVQHQAIENSRLGIPILFGCDVIHGFRTIYPIPLGQACSWNPELVEKACAVAAQEAKMSGVDWTFSPMIDVARDGRWGRVAEGYGEDPLTNAVFGVASVRGYQGNSLSDKNKIAACLKHYIGYGASEGGRDYVYTEVSRQTMWDTYIPPYEAGIKAGAATVMSAFNNINGIPATVNKYTLVEVLKKRWKHQGFVVSDWDAVGQLVNQGVAESRKEAARMAFTAGVEMNMRDNCYRDYLSELVKEGKISLNQIDDAVRRVLRIKFELGLFEHPYTPIVTEDKRYLLPESKFVAMKLAEESIVLLKNKKNMLPLFKQKKIALIGPVAKNKGCLLGSWSAHGKSSDVTSIYEALMLEFENKIQLMYAFGCDFEGEDVLSFTEALNIAKQADIILLCLGEKQRWSGENASRSTIALPRIQEQLALELKKVGKPIVLILSNGRPLDLSRLEPLSDAILEIWQPGINGAQALAGILSGRINPSGKLSITFPYSVGQIPIYYNRRKAARWDQGFYMDITSEPLFPFGYGLSYTEFKYGAIIPSATTVKRGEKLLIEVCVTNTGKCDGAETVHWFISDPYCSVTRPVKELKYFEKQFIRVGETKTYRFEVDLERDLGFVDETGKRFLETGEYYILVGDQQVKVELVD